MERPGLDAVFGLVRNTALLFPLAEMARPGTDGEMAIVAGVAREVATDEALVDVSVSVLCPWGAGETRRPHLVVERFSDGLLTMLSDNFSVLDSYSKMSVCTAAAALSRHISQTISLMLCSMRPYVSLPIPLAYVRPTDREFEVLDAIDKVVDSNNVRPLYVYAKERFKREMESMDKDSALYYTSKKVMLSHILVSAAAVLVAIPSVSSAIDSLNKRIPRVSQVCEVLGRQDIKTLLKGCKIFPTQSTVLESIRTLDGYFLEVREYKRWESEAIEDMKKWQNSEIGKMATMHHLLGSNIVIGYNTEHRTENKEDSNDSGSVGDQTLLGSPSFSYTTPEITPGQSFPAPNSKSPPAGTSGMKDFIIPYESIPQSYKNLLSENSVIPFLSDSFTPDLFEHIDTGLLQAYISPSQYCFWGIMMFAIEEGMGEALEFLGTFIDRWRDIKFEKHSQLRDVRKEEECIKCCYKDGFKSCSGILFGISTKNKLYHRKKSIVTEKEQILDKCSDETMNKRPNDSECGNVSEEFSDIDDKSDIVFFRASPVTTALYMLLMQTLAVSSLPGCSQINLGSSEVLEKLVKIDSKDIEEMQEFCKNNGPGKISKEFTQLLEENCIPNNYTQMLEYYYYWDDWLNSEWEKVEKNAEIYYQGNDEIIRHIELPYFALPPKVLISYALNIDMGEILLLLSLPKGSLTTAGEGDDTYWNTIITYITLLASLPVCEPLYKDNAEYLMRINERHEITEQMRNCENILEKIMTTIERLFNIVSSLERKRIPSWILKIFATKFACRPIVSEALVSRGIILGEDIKEIYNWLHRQIYDKIAKLINKIISDDNSDHYFVIMYLKTLLILHPEYEDNFAPILDELKCLFGDDT